MATTIAFDIQEDLTPEQVEELIEGLRFQVERRRSLALDLDRMIAARAAAVVADEADRDDQQADYEYFRDSILAALWPIVGAGSAAQTLERHGVFAGPALDRVIADCDPDTAHWLGVHRESIEAALLHTARASRIESIGGGRYAIQHPNGSSTPIWEDGLPPALRDEP